MKKILILVVLWAVIINGFAVLVLNRINVSGDTAYRWINPETTIYEKSWNFVELQSRWDSFFYTDIASRGYRINASEVLSNIVFFPLYPILIRTFGYLLFSNYSFAGWVVSIGSLLGAVVVFYKLLKEFHADIKPETAIFYLLIFPTALFLNSVYTESLYLLLSLTTFYFAKKGRFWLAGFVGLLAALTRITGILLFIPLIWEMWDGRRSLKMKKITLLSPLLIPFGTTIFFLYHYVKFGDLFLFFKIESAWGRSFSLNQDHFALHTSSAATNTILDLLFVIFALTMTYLVFNKKWISYGLYMFALIFVALSTGTLMSIGRYILVLFPMYILLAGVRNEYFHRLYTIASVLLLALYITLFANGYWAG